MDIYRKFDLEQAKRDAQPWEFQNILDKLLASGFAVIDQSGTYRWFDENGHKLLYAFTLAGRVACFRNKYTTPMAWAEDIQKGARHCVVCGRDLYRMKVWAHIKGKPGCVCMSCGAKGHGLQDLGKEA